MAIRVGPRRHLCDPGRLLALPDALSSISADDLWSEEVPWGTWSVGEG